MPPVLVEQDAKIRSITRFDALQSTVTVSGGGGSVPTTGQIWPRGNW